MSLINLFKKKSHNTLFTTPSHSGNFFIFHKFQQFYKCDISETDTHNPVEALNSAQKDAAEIYGTKSTHFLTNGSTSGIIAAVLACAPKKILIWKNAHPCHTNAAKLANAKICFYDYEISQELEIPIGVNAKTIEQKLEETHADTVLITSPTYEGFVSKIDEIKRICEKHQAKLIVDEAHGALYPFSDKLPESSVKIADFTVQSLHKTAGGLNPTALLHCNCEINPQNALNIINTTSPSYPLLVTIEANIKFLNSKKGRKKIDELIENIQNCEFEKFNDDITKILLKIKPDSIFERFKIEDEKTNKKCTLFLCGIGTDLKKLKKLSHASKTIKKQL